MKDLNMTDLETIEHIDYLLWYEELNWFKKRLHDFKLLKYKG